jgi:hypothetical protein
VSRPPDPTGLATYASNVYSQYGEDGILERILELIDDRNRWCVEFGAWDGLHLSNCANLIRNREYAGVLIEADTARFAELEANYGNVPNMTALRAFVGFGPGDNLDTLLADVDMPEDPDVLSIDIDGNDYHAWAATQRLHPKVVCIEFNPTVPNALEFVQPADASVQQGSSVRSLVRLGNEKGYELAFCTEANALFVDTRLFPRLGIRDNSLDALRDDSPWVTYLYSGFDGRVMLGGCGSLRWHGLPYESRRVQQLPRFLIGYPGDYSRLQRLAFRGYSQWRRFRRREASLQN